MIKERYEKICIFYDRKFREEKNIVKNSYREIIKIIEKRWGVTLTQKIRIYILNSDLRFLFYASPTYYKVLLFTILLPYWLIVQRKKWAKKRGVCSFKTHTPCILIKPLKYHEDYYKKKFENTKVNNISAKFRRTLSNLFTHVCINDLEIPYWLEEGISLVMMEHYDGEQSLDKTSLTTIQEKVERGFDVEEINLHDEEDYKYLYTKGYWTVKYLEDEYPGLLKEVINQFQKNEIEIAIGEELDISNENRNKLWVEIDNIILCYYNNQNIKNRT